MNKKILTLIFTGVLVFSSCDSVLDINRDPDLLRPDQIPLNSQMPAGITGVAGSAGSYFALIGGFWSQFWTQSAVANQYKSIDDYTINAGASIINRNWSSMYDALTDIRSVKAKAEIDGNWNYYLMATVMEVYASQILVDFYGSIPYTQANNSSILTPAFESADVVYDLMEADLSNALSKDLSTSNTDIIPGNDDFLFGGDMTKWTQFANTLLLKVYLRQSEIRGSVAEAGAKALLTKNNFLMEDAAITQFEDKESRSNPLYESDRRKLNVKTNLRASTTLGSFLNQNSDPRLGKFYDGTTFQDQGDFDKGSSSASIVILNPTDAFYFISEAESYFLQAEADLRYNGGANAQALYEKGVKAAFTQWGLDGTSLLAGAYAYPAGTIAENLEAIITQKWISFFPGNGYEAFIEHNRTNYPVETTTAQSDPAYIPGQFAYSIEGQTGKVFPRRLEYPIDESQRNPNTPAVIPITEKVWYDVN
ncbi:MAG: SusD/RagB family nutrient-binding outer membrane lipoprotein [Flavobacteriales bacterium]